MLGFGGANPFGRMEDEGASGLLEAAEPRDADFATRWMNIIAQVRLRVVHHIIEVGTRFTKLLSDARLSLNSFTGPSIADAFMLSAIGTASVNNDWEVQDSALLRQPE